MMSGIKAVTFDFWNTLMWEGPDALVTSRLKALLGVAEEKGWSVTSEQLHAAHQSAFGRYQSAWQANQQFCVPDAVQCILQELGIEPGLATRTMLIEAFDHAGEEAEIHLAEGVVACLERLAALGVKLSIVCDIGLTPSPVLRRRLARLGLLDLFGSWAFSDEVGCYKPEAKIFEHALAGLGLTDPSTAAHVGDRRRTDVAGAAAMGMLSVRYTGVYDDPTEGPEALIVTDCFSDLPERLEIA
ncbi:MAG TPA: HAD family hydrolase [Acidimicrobiia bacterium]|nr:HAD family hydrolase [Acidimicrobiia bacterium]